MLFDRADHAESVDDFIADEIGVVAADFTVMMIVVRAFALDERCQRGRQFFRFVFRNQIHDVIRNERRKPSHTVARDFHVARSPDGSSGHHLDLAEIAAGFFGALRGRIPGTIR